MPRRKPPADPKDQRLRARGVRNPHPERVSDDLFQTTTFFDPRDLLQVRYEMLRRHRHENLPVAQTVRRFGVSRPTFYHLADTYNRDGAAGLIPRKRGPKGATRCTPPIIQFVQQRRADSPDLSWEDLLHEVTDRFGVSLHRRSIERGLARVRKNGRWRRRRSSRTARP